MNFDVRYFYYLVYKLFILSLNTYVQFLDIF